MAKKILTASIDNVLVEAVRISKSSEKEGKKYDVTVTLIQLTDEAAKTKRDIIESIMKKGWKKPL